MIRQFNDSSRTVLIAFALLATVLAFSGCGGKKLDGVYHGASGGPVTITIKGGKAIVEVMGETKTFDYKVDGNKLTIINPQEGNLVLTINDDGTLTGPLGMMSKTAS